MRYFIASVFNSIFISLIFDILIATIENWPEKDKIGVYEGDIKIGGIFMVHDRHDSLICGDIFTEIGIQQLEMMIYALDIVNQNFSHLLHGMTLGGVFVDDCDRDTVGVERSLEFVRGKFSSHDSQECSNKQGGAMKDDSSKKGSTGVVGVIGAASSVVSIQVASLLRLFSIPQVSYWSTSPELSNKERFDYFMRTVPSDEAQVSVMFDIIRFFNWTYVQVVYEDSNYGLKASNHILEMEKQYPDICVAQQLALPRDSQRERTGVYDNIFRRMLNFKNARGKYL
ncbi:metabotropic glutamate receptor 4-like [Symsagittifera roscoffensis]|uniref:metabotropic glutamate receptor 4-like n=1 Tax=Symsagittifera roscoffensis TaxID=84072 RepID=UPI00307B5CE7